MWSQKSPETVAEGANLKNFLGGMPPDPPRLGVLTHTILTSYNCNYVSPP